MQICVLSDSELREFDPSQYLENFSWDIFIPQKPVVDFIRALAQEGNYDVYFNLCDGADNPQEDYDGIDVVRALEVLKLPFTGANSRFYDPSREVMQSVAEANGLRFARGVQILNVDELEAMENLLYPLMVKHPQSFASTAMTRNSRVENLQKLREQVKRICNRFGSARVEEFIEGPEFTVLVVDNPDDLECPFVYPPAELIFPPGEDFLHSSVKWKEWVHLKPVKDKAIALRLMEMTRDMYLAMDGVGYARCDIRMGPDGGLYMIEINPNCGILFKPEDLGPADVAMEYDVNGHAGFLDRIFRAAINRNKAAIETAIPKSR
jgi:D-alanine-D-alanine ligase